MAYTKEQRKEYDRKYYEANKQKLNQQRKEYYETNKESIKEQQKEYKDANKQQIKEYQKKYYRIRTWKIKGVISDDFNALYEKYINTNECELCGVNIGGGKGVTNKKHLYYCNISGQFKNILCGVCNVINDFNL